MDELEYACAAVVNIAATKPGDKCSLDDLRLFNFRKNLDLRYAIEDLNKVLRARLAQKSWFEAQDSSGNAEPVVTSSRAVTDKDATVALIV